MNDCSIPLEFILKSRFGCNVRKYVVVYGVLELTGRSTPETSILSAKWDVMVLLLFKLCIIFGP